MLGAIIGDIVGSPYEFSSPKRKDITLFDGGCSPTDDSLMTIAVGCACAQADVEDEADFKRAVIRYMKEIGRLYPDAGYGRDFYYWLTQDNIGPYGSYGNGSAMRVSAVAYVAGSLAQAEQLAKWSAEVTHNHPEGIKGAMAVAAAIYMARKGKDKQQIRDYLQEKYYDLSFTLDEIRPTYVFDVSCTGSVPQALVCFLEAENYVDALRNAISLGGDGDTIAAIAGGIAEAYFGIPTEIEERGLSFLDDCQLDYYESYASILYE